jgi:hypothetical protein
MKMEAFVHHGRWRPRLLQNGLEVPAWEAPMPRISDEILQSVFYLYPSFQAAEAGEHAGGCGFFALVPFERGVKNHLYMVTNRHVIDRGGLTARINTEPDKSAPFDTDDRNWFRHPDGDDLAILLVDFPLAFTCNGLELLKPGGVVTLDLIQMYDLGIGDDVYTVGRFVNHDGKQKNNPVVRFGNIAQMPIEPIKQDTGHLQESYLVECRSVAGYSGSPVFIYIPPFAVRPKKPNSVESRAYGPWFLGVNWGHLNEWKPVCDSSGRPIGNTPMKVALNSGMMGVVPAWKLLEMLKHPKIIERRKEEEKKLLGDGPPIASSDAAHVEPSPPSSDVNPKHREDFTSLVNAAARKPAPKD